MGVYYLNYIKGEVTTDSLAFSFFVDLVNTASYFVRCTLQFGRIMIFMMYYLNHHKEILKEGFLLLSTVDSSEPLIIYLMWAANLSSEFSDLMSIFAVQSTAFIAILAWLNSFLVTFVNKDDSNHKWL